MKKIVFLLIPILVLVSCTKDFITKEPLGVGSDKTWFDTEDQCRMSVNAMYDPLGWQTLYQRNAEVLDMLSDDAEKGGAVTNKNAYKADQSEMYKMALYNADPTNVVANNFWKTHYIIIARTNLMIDRTASKEDIPAYKAMRAEARFLRAFAYMDLVKMFGAVPLVIDVKSPLEASSYSNAGDKDKQIEEIYKFIISELEAIKGVLPMRQPLTDFGKVSDGAVRAYLAKAYLYAGSFVDKKYFSDAYSTAKELITIGKASYGLTAEYQRVFDFDKITDEGTINEIIFAIQYVNGANDSRENEGNIRVIDNHPRVTVNEKGVAVENTGVGYGLVIPTQKLVKAFEVGDPRLDMIAKSKQTAPSGVADSIYWTVKVAGKDSTGWWKIGKVQFNTGNYTMKNFLNQAVYNGQPSGKDYILMRWAEVLLIGAEAAVRTGNTKDATDWVNEIRERARNSNCTKKAPTMAEWKFDTPATVPAKEEGSVTLKQVKEERQKELFCEHGTRYFDLLRWNKTNDGDGISADEILATIGTDLAGEARAWNPIRKGLFPININEIRAHGGNLVQNDGY